MDSLGVSEVRTPWNKGTLVGQKAPLKVRDIWAIRVRLQIRGRVRDLALFDLGIDSKLRACDLVQLRVRDVCHGNQVTSRAIVMQNKTQRSVQFEITASTRDVLESWIKSNRLKADDYLFPSRLHSSPHPVPGNMPESLMAGCKRSDSIPPPMALTRFGVPNRR
jgi:integrase